MVPVYRREGVEKRHLQEAAWSVGSTELSETLPFPC